MLSRFISRTSHLRLRTLTTSYPQCSKLLPLSSPSPNPSFLLAFPKSFSANHNNGDNGGAKDQSQFNVWKILDRDEDEDPWPKEEGREVDALAGVDKSGAGEGHSSWTFGEEGKEGRQIGDSAFNEDEGTLAGIADGSGEEWPKGGRRGVDTLADVNKWGAEEGHADWTLGAEGREGSQIGDSVFGGDEGNLAGIADGDRAEEGHMSWTLDTEEKEDDVFDLGDQAPDDGGVLEDSNAERERKEEEKLLEREEKELKAVLKGNVQFLLFI